MPDSVCIVSGLDVLNGTATFHLFQHVVRVQSLELLSVNGGKCEWSDQTIIFEYHPTPVMDVQMPNDMKSCETRSLQMVLSQGKNYSAVVKVSENYGYAGKWSIIFKKCMIHKRCQISYFTS